MVINLGEVDFGKKILVPVDGSNNSNVGVERACQMAKLLDSQMTLIHVVTTPVMAEAALYLDYKVFERLGSQILENSLKIVEKNGLKASALLEHGFGNAGHTIVEVAREQGFTLIVIGSTGHTIGTHLIGSVSDSVVHDAPCCVLVVRMASEHRQ